jgi:hypothetical protein
MTGGRPTSQPPSRRWQRAAVPSPPPELHALLVWGSGCKGCGEVDLEFHCLDGSAHAAVRATLRSGDQCMDTPGQSVVLILRVEAAALDSFVAQLGGLEPGRAKGAVLEGAS